MPRCLRSLPVHIPDPIEVFVRPLHQKGVRYLIAGSLGSMFYGEPRMTVDIDLAVALSESNLRSLISCFPEPEFYCPPIEVLQGENARECRGHFNIIHVPSGFKADFYPSQHDAFFSWAWTQRRVVTLQGVEMNYAPPEYIIVWKTAYFREGGGEKHVRDIRRMLDISADQIDEAILRDELRKRGLWETFADLRQSGSPRD